MSLISNLTFEPCQSFEVAAHAYGTVLSRNLLLVSFVTLGLSAALRSQSCTFPISKCLRCSYFSESSF